MKREREPLRWREVAQAVRQQHIGRSVVYRTEVDSTMEVCHALARAGADPGVVVVTDAQSAGRGRQGRAWQARPSTCLLFSVLLRPALTRDQWPHVLWPLSLALQEATQSVTGLQTAIKWPNDLVFGGKKLGGLLAETAANGVVVGAGLNVNFPAAALALDQPLTTLSDALGQPVCREELLIASLRSFE
ncbi:MAG: biotin--[acetyl-CoA-carboxylase] ligase, partial [Chloroflexi bacterium]|nr:biotin--[acetyl-CoA-carboxylase] ligase [Chloroflexota bacterium]